MENLSGRNRREIDELFRNLGGEITELRRTGENLYRHPLLPKPVRVNRRRKDAPRSLSQAVHQLLRITRSDWLK